MSSEKRPNENIDNICEKCSCELINYEMLQKTLWPNSDKDILQSIADELNFSINIGEIDSERALCHFLGQARVENGDPIVLFEKFNYTESNLRNLDIYKKNSDKDLAAKHAQIKDPIEKARKIANFRYKKRMGNGDEASGDGFRYRGRGLFQLTGKSNYESLDKEYPKYWEGVEQFSKDNKNFFVKNPDSVAAAPYHTRSALWFWVSKGCSGDARRDKVGNTMKFADLKFTKEQVRSTRSKFLEDLMKYTEKELVENDNLSKIVSCMITEKINRFTASYGKRYEFANKAYTSRRFKAVCYNTRISLCNKKAFKPKTN